jgi:hypothetical protein
MKKSDDKFEWTEEADTTFAKLEKVLSTPPVLVAPNEKEPLLLYIAATHQVVSTVDAFDGAQLTREIILLRSLATAPEKELLARG